MAMSERATLATRGYEKNCMESNYGKVIDIEFVIMIEKMFRAFMKEWEDDGVSSEAYDGAAMGFKLFTEWAYKQTDDFIDRKKEMDDLKEKIENIKNNMPIFMDGV